MSGAIKVQVGMGGLVAKITLNRPDKMNAFDREMLRELGDIVRGVSDSEKLRVVLITGEGKGFCAGGDLEAAKASGETSNYLGKLATSFHNVLDTLASSPALVVTVVNGIAAGGGMALALAGDLRVAMPEAKFRLGYGRVGLSMDGGLSWRLPRMIGAAQAQRIVFTDPEIDADEAHALGLVHQVTANSDIPTALQGLVDAAKKQSRGSILKHRHLLAESQGRTL
ncbi:MAG TPA: enoyl-CoA hydratase/isomerase family protein, partial [Planctomycetota bacterium]